MKWPAVCLTVLLVQTTACSVAGGVADLASPIQTAKDLSAGAASSAHNTALELGILLFLIIYGCCLWAVGRAFFAWFRAK